MKRISARAWVWIALYAVLLLYGLASGSLLGAVLIGIAIPLYFLPGLIAIRRGHPQQQSIAVINALLGWTAIGWIMALVWAVSAIPERPG